MGDIHDYLNAFLQASSMLDTQASTYNQQNSEVQSFTSLDAAIIAWRQALADHSVIPLGHCSESLGANDTTTASEDTFSAPDVPDEWHRAAYEHGPKWVVWKGRFPGIYDTWAQVHAEVHGQVDPWSTYQRFASHQLAYSAWERLSHDAYPHLPFGQDPVYPTTQALEMCTECGDGN